MDPQTFNFGLVPAEWDLLARAAVSVGDPDDFARGILEAIHNLEGARGDHAVMRGRLQLLLLWLAQSDEMLGGLYDQARGRIRAN